MQHWSKCVHSLYLSIAHAISIEITFGLYVWSWCYCFHGWGVATPISSIPLPFLNVFNKKLWHSIAKQCSDLLCSCHKFIRCCVCPLPYTIRLLIRYVSAATTKTHYTDQKPYSVTKGLIIESKLVHYLGMMLPNDDGMPILCHASL